MAFDAGARAAGTVNFLDLPFSGLDLDGALDAISVRAEQFELPCPHAQVYLAPCIAGHVGADTAAPT